MWALIFLRSISAVGFYALGWTYAHEAPDNNWSWHTPKHHDPVPLFCYSAFAVRLGGIFIGVRPLLENPRTMTIKFSYGSGLF
jgi:hypothetical protein